MVNKGIIVVHLADLPETVFAMRRELAKMLVEVALDEDARTAKRLREIAMYFEVGTEV